MTTLIVNFAAVLAVACALFFAVRQYKRLKAFFAGRGLQTAVLHECNSIMENRDATARTRAFAARLALLVMCTDSLYWFAMNHKALKHLTKSANPLSDSERSVVSNAVNAAAMLSMFYHPKYGGYFQRSFKQHLHEEQAELATQASKEALTETKKAKPKASKLVHRVESEIFHAVAA